MLEQNLDRAPRPPTLKKGRYVIAGVLGKGGNAGVYQAWDTQLRQWRAIKVLAHEFIKDDEVRARFAQEAATMARLEHPNLVRVFDISDDPFTPHIVMEICAGGSIIQWMKAHGAVPPQLALDVVRATALGVQRAHAIGMVHRDIKPQNILITEKGVIKLTDFGIARDTDNSLTQAGATIGTYAFMAPEQRHDSTVVDQRADVYSLGATLFTMLQVKTTTELFVADRGDEILEGIPEPALDVILRCCAYKPKNRYPDIAAFLVAVDQAKAALPPDPEHPPIQANTMVLPDEPPSGLPDFSKLEDLLKSLALNDDTPTYMERPDNTTLGSSIPASVDQAMPYVMPSHASSSEPAPTGRPSYIDEEEFTRVTATPAPVAAAPPPLPEEPGPLPATQNPVFIGAAALTVMLIALIGCVFMGASQVNNLSSQAERAQVELLEAVKASAPAVSRAPNAAVIETLFFAATEGPPAERPTALAAYIAEIRAARNSEHLDDHGGLLIDNVQHANERLLKANHRWQQAATSPLGRAAVSVGLATPPPLVHP